MNIGQTPDKPKLGIGKYAHRFLVKGRMRLELHPISWVTYLKVEQFSWLLELLAFTTQISLCLRAYAIRILTTIIGA